MAETLLRRDFPFEPQADYPTVLSRMLYEGALLEAEMQLAGLSEQEALGYTDAQMAWLEKNERKMQEKLVGGKMLFSTDEQLAASLVNPAPFTSAVSNESLAWPGASSVTASSAHISTAEPGRFHGFSRPASTNRRPLSRIQATTDALHVPFILIIQKSPLYHIVK